MKLYFAEWSKSANVPWQHRWFRTEDEAWRFIDELVATNQLDRSEYSYFSVLPHDINIPTNSWMLVDLLNHLEARPPA